MVILKTARELHKSLFLPSQKRFALGWGLSFITAKLIVYGFVCCTEPRNKPARTFHFEVCDFRASISRVDCLRTSGTAIISLIARFSEARGFLKQFPKTSR